MSLLQTRNLSVERGGAAIVDDINLDIQAGELVMLVGPQRGGQIDPVAATGRCATTQPRQYSPAGPGNR